MSIARLTENSGFVMVTFPASWLSIYAKPTGNGRYTPVTLADAMADGKVVAALDGPMFNNCDPGKSYEQSSCADPRFAQLDKDDRILDAPNRGNDRDGVSVSIVDGQAIWSQGGLIDPRATVGMQFYPSLVRNGVVASVSSSGSNAERVGRAALLGLQDGSLAFGMARDNLQGFARRCGAAGAIWAGYTDGGGSTALGYRPEGESLRQWGNTVVPRPVAVFLVAKPPEQILGMSPAVAVGVGVVALVAVSAVALSMPTVRRMLFDV